MKKTIKNKLDIITILERIASKTHKIETSIKNQLFSSIILEINDGLILCEFEPFFINKKPKQLKKLSLEVSEVHDMILYNYIFTVKLKERTKAKHIQGYRYTLPKKIKYTSEKYRIIPDDQNKIEISFEIKGLKQYKSVTYITKERVCFKGNYEFLEDQLGKTIYDIHIRLPFNRIKCSGSFKKLENHFYCFEDYIVSEMNSDILNNHAIDDFIRKNNFDDFKDKIFREKKINSHVATSQKSFLKKNAKILLVDDKYMVTEIIKEILEAKTNYEIITTNVSIEAFDLIKKEQPDLVVLDKNMPKITGLEIAQKMRAIEITREIPIIIMTAYDDHTDKSLLNSYGISGYIVKPVDSEELISTIDSILFNKIKNFNLAKENIVICSDNYKFNNELKEILNKEKINLFIKNYPEEMDDLDSKFDYRVIILNLTSKNYITTTVLNSLRKQRLFADSIFIVIPQSRRDKTLLEILDDEKVQILNNKLTANEIAKILIKMTE